MGGRVLDRERGLAAVQSRVGLRRVQNGAICKKTVQRHFHLISQIHAVDYYHEFDLVNRCEHPSGMGIQFDTANRVRADQIARLTSSLSFDFRELPVKRWCCQ
jgi:hypothetical protein